LYIVFDRKYISEEGFDEVYKLLIVGSKMLNGLIYYLKNPGFKGRKFIK